MIQVVEDVRAYKNFADRKRALAMLVRQRKWSGFVFFNEVNGPAIMMTKTFFGANPEHPSIQQ